MQTYGSLPLNFFDRNPLHPKRDAAFTEKISRSVVFLGTLSIMLVQPVRCALIIHGLEML